MVWETLADGQIELSVSGDGRRLLPASSQLVDTRHALHRSMLSNNQVARLQPRYWTYFFLFICAYILHDLHDLQIVIEIQIH